MHSGQLIEACSHTQSLWPQITGYKRRDKRGEARRSARPAGCLGAREREKGRDREGEREGMNDQLSCDALSQAENDFLVAALSDNITVFRNGMRGGEFHWSSVTECYLCSLKSEAKRERPQGQGKENT